MVSLYERVKEETTRVAIVAWRPVSKTRPARFGSDIAQAIQAVVHEFAGEKISLRAAALTFIGIFSLVPLLTVALVLLQKLEQTSFHVRLKQFINDVLAPGVAQDSVAALDRFIDAASANTAGAFGFLALMASAGMLLRNIDASLNEIWNVRRARPLHIRVLFYLLVLTVGPVLVALSLAATASVRTVLLSAHIPFSRQLLEAGALSAAVGAFTLLYFLAPNAPVRFRSALAGGLLGGVAWEAAKHAYAEFAALMFRYNPLYASLGVAPLFLVWIYLSWLLVLFGARLSYAVEHASMGGVLRDLGEHPRARELIAARIAQRVTYAFMHGLPPPATRELARTLKVPGQRIDEITEQLEEAGLVIIGRKGGVRPARDPSRLTLADLSRAVGGLARSLASADPSAQPCEFTEIGELFSPADVASATRLARVSWLQLSARLALEDAVSADAPTAQVSLRGG